MDPRKHLCWSGCLVYVLMMGTAFIDYVLPWGAMIFWGVTIITSMITIIHFKLGEGILILATQV